VTSVSPVFEVGRGCALYILATFMRDSCNCRTVPKSRHCVQFVHHIFSYMHVNMHQSHFGHAVPPVAS